MKLSMKITCAMGMLFLCITLMGYVSMQRLYDINNVYGDAAQTGFPLTVSAQKLVILLSEYRRNEINHVLNAESGNMQRAGNRMSDLRDSIEETLSMYMKHARNEARQAQGRELERLWKEYSQTSRRVQELSRDGAVKPAARLLNSRSSDQYDTLSMVAGKLAAANALFSENALRNGDVLYARATLQLLGMIVGILLLVIGTTMFLLRTVMRTLGTEPANLCNFALRVANGDLDVAPDEKATGVYADVLRMVSVLRKQNLLQEALIANVPGAVMRMVNDTFFTINFSSDGLQHMLGYSNDEVAVLFDNHFVNMIVPEDRFPCMQRMREQLVSRCDYEVEYRARHKEGHDVWVLDRGRLVTEENEVGVVYSVLIDVSEVKVAQRKIQIQEERIRTVLTVSNDMVWESDAKKLFRFIKGSAIWLHEYGTYPKNYEEALERAISLCHPDDVAHFRHTLSSQNIIESQKDGIPSLRLEYRTANFRTGHYTWYQTTVVPFLDKNGTIDRIMSCTININDRKSREIKILISAQRDPLTNLYNKGFTEEEITRFLHEEGSGKQHALFIIDVDNFKAVNDNLGHLFGDGVLSDIAGTLVKLFNPRDLVGRIGGDEFMVLMKDLSDDVDVITRKGKDVSDGLCRAYGGNSEYVISGSVGIARFPAHGTTYVDLYKHADVALYEAKRQGKRCACLYTPEMEASAHLSLAPARALTDMARRADRASFNDNVMIYIFELLYEARDVGNVVNIALGMIGKHYHVSRAYVFQNDPGNDSFSNTHEWCAEGIVSEKDNLQNLPFFATGNYLASFTRDGVYYCEDVSKLEPSARDLLERQGIKSMLHLAIYDQGTFRGCVGFDDCNGNRKWTRDEVSTLSVLAKILGLYLLKDSVSRQLEDAYTNITTILDSMDVFAYVCDEDTYKLLYVNAKTRAAFPDTVLGTTCHSAFFGGKTEPCVPCPRRELPLSADGTCPLFSEQCSMTIHNPVLDVWTRTSASRIPWSNGKPAVLLTCVDVTDYKLGRA